MDDLCDYVRGTMPVRSRLLGRTKVNEIVATTVREWPATELSSCRGGSTYEADLLEATADRVSEATKKAMSSERYGNILLLYLLAGAVSAVVQAVMYWWLTRKQNQDAMLAWQRAAKGGS